MNWLFRLSWFSFSGILVAAKGGLWPAENKGTILEARDLATTKGGSLAVTEDEKC